jgi:hypothetical protein
MPRSTEVQIRRRDPERLADPRAGIVKEQQ